jgi:hypothetical protein
LNGYILADISIDRTLSIEQQEHDLKFWRNKKLAKELARKKELEKQNKDKEA